MSARHASMLLALAVAFGAATVAAQETDRGLSDKDKADEAQTIVTALKNTLAQVERKVEDARRDRDVLRLTCVNDRKTQIAELLKVSELSLEELKAAVKDRQTEAVDHEFNKIKITRQKIEQYKQEADQCIGLLAFYDNDKIQVIIVDSNTDSADMEVLSYYFPTATIVRPSPASPNR